MNYFNLSSSTGFLYSLYKYLCCRKKVYDDFNNNFNDNFPNDFGIIYCHEGASEGAYKRR